jgi:hypothetical protein
VDQVCDQEQQDTFLLRSRVHFAPAGRRTGHWRRVRSLEASGARRPPQRQLAAGPAERGARPAGLAAACVHGSTAPCARRPQRQCRGKKADPPPHAMQCRPASVTCAVSGAWRERGGNDASKTRAAHETGRPAPGPTGDDASHHSCAL